MIKAIAIDDEPLALKVIEILCLKTNFIDLQKTFTKPSEALKYLRKYPTDLIFVDIHMPSISGISLVKELQQNTMVIFTTAFSEYAAISYELNAIEYLLKPINQRRFDQAVNKARDFFNIHGQLENIQEKYIFVRADFSLIKIILTKILLIEGFADYLKIHIEGQKTIVTRMPMKVIMEKLPSSDFIRVHRSFILPFTRIESVRNKTISTKGKDIPIGKSYVEDFFNRYKI